MKWSTKGCVLILAATLISMTLRVPRLAQRPLHGDEAVHADKFGTLLEEGVYEYDPFEYHGPTLNYFTLVPAWLTSVDVLAEATELTIRIVPVFFGVMLVVLLLLLRDAMGPKPAAVAAVLTAISPAMVFYSRYYIQEMLLVSFTFAAIVSGYRYARSRRLAWAIATGVFLGLMDATKETCIISYAAMLLALVFVLLLRRRRAGNIADVLESVKSRDIALGLAAALIVAGLFFSSFLTHPSGVVDSIRTYTTYFDRAQHSGIHDHPWYYYLHLLTYFQIGEGPFWTEGLIVVLALVGFFAALRGRDFEQGQLSFFRFIAFYTALMTLIYSAIPYKTPWCLLGFLHGMILLAGLGAVRLVRAAPHAVPRLIIMLLLFEAGVHLGWQAWLNNYRYYADSRNPYVYAHPTEEVFRVPELLSEYAAVHEDGYSIPISVICADKDYWPLPWYLRRFDRVGYHHKVPNNAADKAIHLVSPQFEGALANTLYVQTPVHRRNMYMFLFDEPYYIWLRPKIKLTGFVRKDVWEALRNDSVPPADISAPETKTTNDE